MNILPTKIEQFFFIIRNLNYHEVLKFECSRGKILRIYLKSPSCRPLKFQTNIPKTHLNIFTNFLPFDLVLKEISHSKIISLYISMSGDISVCGKYSAHNFIASNYI